MSDGASVYLCTSDDEVIDLVSRGQGVFGIAVGKVLREVESTLVELDAQPADPMDELAARRGSRSAPHLLTAAAARSRRSGVSSSGRAAHDVR